MSVLSAQTIWEMRLLEPMVMPTKDSQGNSYGLSACGYDLQIDQDIEVYPNGITAKDGYMVLASTMEHFHLPDNVVGIVHDKSSLARRGLAVQNTVAEPGWRGYLTLELSNHGQFTIRFKKGDAVAQVVFHFLDEPTSLPYTGKYQDQTRGPHGNVK